jgi:hypothetical protein
MLDDGGPAVSGIIQKEGRLLTDHLEFVAGRAIQAAVQCTQRAVAKAQ